MELLCGRAHGRQLMLGMQCIAIESIPKMDNE